MQTDLSPKSFPATTLLCCCLGLLGVHRFIVGKVGTGILMLLTLRGLGLWLLVDLLLIICGSFTDKQGRLIRQTG